MGHLPTLRVLIADERADVLDALAGVVRASGHDPVACEAGVAETARAAERHDPDVAVVAVHEDLEHALELLGALASAGIPVVVALDEADEQFIAEAASRGVVAQARPFDPDGMTTALRLAHTRGRELARSLTERAGELEAQMRNRAVVERAKGVLMERHDVTEPDAYEMLRRRAREERRTLVELARAVLAARQLLPGPEKPGDRERDRG